MFLVRDDRYDHRRCLVRRRIERQVHDLTQLHGVRLFVGGAARLEMVDAMIDLNAGARGRCGDRPGDAGGKHPRCQPIFGPKQVRAVSAARTVNIFADFICVSPTMQFDSWMSLFAD